MSARQLIEAEDFAAWFGRSKVVDEAGQPLIVWHGTSEKFDVFDMGQARDGAHFFSASASHAAYFGDARGYYVKIENPKVISHTDLENRWDELVNDGGESGVLPRDMVEHFVRDAKQEGRDGLIIKPLADLDLEADVYLPFTPAQIRPA